MPIYYALEGLYSSYGRGIAYCSVGAARFPFRPQRIEQYFFSVAVRLPAQRFRGSLSIYSFSRTGSFRYSDSKPLFRAAS